MTSDISGLTNSLTNTQSKTGLPSVLDKGNAPTQQSGSILPVRGPGVSENTTANHQPQQKDLERLTEQLNKFVQARDNKLQFSLDDGTGRTVIKVVNRETDEIIRQFPPEEILSLSKMLHESIENMAESASGILFETEG